MAYASFKREDDEEESPDDGGYSTGTAAGGAFGGGSPNGLLVTPKQSSESGGGPSGQYANFDKVFAANKDVSDRTATQLGSNALRSVGKAQNSVNGLKLDFTRQLEAGTPRGPPTPSTYGAGFEFVKPDTRTEEERFGRQTGNMNTPNVVSGPYTPPAFYNNRATLPGGYSTTTTATGEPSGFGVKRSNSDVPEGEGNIPTRPGGTQNPESTVPSAPVGGLSVSGKPIEDLSRGDFNELTKDSGRGYTGPSGLEALAGPARDLRDRLFDLRNQAG
jgi:hypothetical protein